MAVLSPSTRLALVIDQRPAADALEHVVLGHRGEDFGRAESGSSDLEHGDRLADDHAAAEVEPVAEA